MTEFSHRNRLHYAKRSRRTWKCFGCVYKPQLAMYFGGRFERVWVPSVKQSNMQARRHGATWFSKRKDMRVTFELRIKGDY